MKRLLYENLGKISKKEDLWKGKCTFNYLLPHISFVLITVIIRTNLFHFIVCCMASSLDLNLDTLNLNEKLMMELTKSYMIYMRASPMHASPLNHYKISHFNHFTLKYLTTIITKCNP